MVTDGKNNKKGTIPENRCADSSFMPKYIVILSKTTRLDYERQKHPYLSHAQFTALLERRDWNYDEIKSKHVEQQSYVRTMCKILESHGIRVKIVSKNEYNTVIASQADAIFSAGGDGTFLIAAEKIRSNIAVIGFNTDPIGSEGYLCITRKEKQPICDVIAKLLKGEFRWIRRQRIRVTILEWVEDDQAACEIQEELCDTDDKLRKARLFQNDDSSPEFPLLALNDVFIGESHAARVSYYDVQVDDGPIIKQKSSGLTVCTGTGSTSWFGELASQTDIQLLNYNINRVSSQHVDDLLAIMRSMNILSVNPTEQINREICKQFNEKLTFDAESSHMAFTIRDPVFNATFPPGIQHGFARRIRVKSRCTNAHIILDGSVSVPFNSGTEILLEIHDVDLLRSIMLLH